ncbi:MAG: ribonuclease HI family protein [Candidatus Magasanikbacteria bacterium]|nr:ribonuclease HI family protein [Candidatus Magasanikbacteria bacterium]MCA9391256.1 ribonuclease HI family protein [Candidatus Magasanikbacteria bacterium]USN52769.1 MAG: ribonuclease HI family protein [Candidatus Nomurabacteria bacterium]HPF95334.1 ribonuclease HI family protein [bacterium]
MQLIVRTDGGARGNPGPAGFGAVIEDANGKVLEEHAVFLGRKTNNQAEYAGAIFALRRAGELGATEVTLYSDSELMIKQANGEYKVKHPNVVPLFQDLFRAERVIGKVKYIHVRREQNKHADALSNKAMDEGMGIVKPAAVDDVTG